MKTSSIIIAALMITCNICAQTQTELSDESIEITGKENSGRFLNIGFGASGWGVPVYANLEFPIKFENQSISVGCSFQTKSESYGRYYGETLRWNHSIIGVQGAWNYSLDELISQFIEIPEEFELQTGAQLDVYIWKSTLSSDFENYDVAYSGAGRGNVGFSIRTSARYYFGENDRLSANVSLRGGTVMSSGRVGISLSL
jgi:hypothetical protein